MATDAKWFVTAFAVCGGAPSVGRCAVRFMPALKSFGGGLGGSCDRVANPSSKNRDCGLVLAMNAAAAQPAMPPAAVQRCRLRQSQRRYAFKSNDTPSPPPNSAARRQPQHELARLPRRPATVRASDRAAAPEVSLDAPALRAAAVRRFACQLRAESVDGGAQDRPHGRQRRIRSAAGAHSHHHHRRQATHRLRLPAHRSPRARRCRQRPRGGAHPGPLRQPVFVPQRCVVVDCHLRIRRLRPHAPQEPARCAPPRLLRHPP